MIWAIDKRTLYIERERVSTERLNLHVPATSESSLYSTFRNLRKPFYLDAWFIDLGADVCAYVYNANLMQNNRNHWFIESLKCNQIELAFIVMLRLQNVCVEFVVCETKSSSFSKKSFNNFNNATTSSLVSFHWCIFQLVGMLVFRFVIESETKFRQFSMECAHF